MSGPPEHGLQPCERDPYRFELSEQMPPCGTCSGLPRDAWTTSSPTLGNRTSSGAKVMQRRPLVPFDGPAGSPGSRQLVLDEGSYPRGPVPAAGQSESRYR